MSTIIAGANDYEKLSAQLDYEYRDELRRKGAERKQSGLIEYTPVDPKRLHPDTFELVHRHYFWLTDSYPWCVTIHQIYNTIRACAPDLTLAIASIKQAVQRIIADMRTYPDDAWELAQALPYIEEFCERVQETSARLHNGEDAKRANIEALNRLHIKSEQRAEEARQRWQAEVEAGDAYFGGPGAYQRIREEMYATLDMKAHEALRERIRAFQSAYRSGTLAAQEQCEPEPVQVELWEVA